MDAIQFQYVVFGIILGALIVICFLIISALGSYFGASHALVPSDVVYTPDDVARDVVSFFKPTGKILEPCAGDGAFLRYLPPDTDWCEIEKGRDFFAYHEHVEWIVGNPPFMIWYKWIHHSFDLADNVVYIAPPGKVLGSFAMFEIIRNFGGIRTLYILGPGNRVGFPFGYAIAAFHFQRGYKDGTFTHFRENHNGRK